MTEAREGQKFRTGYVAILGRPNAGKSTLLNRCAGQKIAIVTSKPQTTRNRIQGIANVPGAQIVFVDTPGLHKADSALGRQMMREVAAAVEGVDVLLLMVDAAQSGRGPDEFVLHRAREFKGPVILALNKIDRIPRPKLLPLIASYAGAFEFAAIVPLSALKGEGLDDLLQEIVKRLPEGEAQFPEDEVTDQPERFLAAEIIREKAVNLTYHEVPHALAVIVDKYEQTPKILKIHATLTVEREAQKKILIGSKGEMLKKVGTQARKELERLLGGKIYLELYVKVSPDWRENPQKVRELDWHVQLEEMAAAEEAEGGEED